MRDPIKELSNITFPPTAIDRDSAGEVLERVHRRGSRIRRRRATLAAVAVVAGVGAVGAPLALASGLVGSSEQTVVADSGGARPTTTTTVLKLEARDCEGCEFQLTQGLWDADAPSGATIWQSDEKTVRNGTVTFTVPKSRTRGMSITIDAPWEGQLAGASTVVMGYRGHTDDTDVTSQEARGSEAASACWGGTDADAVTIDIATEQAETDGVHERVTGTRAFTRTTMDSVQPPLRPVDDGVLSSADHNICGDRP